MTAAPFSPPRLRLEHKVVTTAWSTASCASDFAGGIGSPVGDARE
jgi:hypothetical protein